MDFRQLYETWRLEASRDELQRLPKAFYAELGAYLAELRRRVEALEKGTLEHRLVVRELNRAELLVKKLIELRKQKVLRDAARAQVPVDQCSEEELDICKKLASVSCTYSKILSDVLTGKVPELEKPKKLILVRFLKPLPAIVGVDLRTYGPFKRGDIASLPAENVEVLVKQGVVVKAEVE